MSRRVATAGTGAVPVDDGRGRRWTRTGMVLVALGVLTATAATTAPRAAPPDSGSAPGAAAVPAAASTQASAPTIRFDGETGALTGIPDSANATVPTTAARNGSRGLRLSSTAAMSYARWNTTVVPQGETHASVRLWVRVLSRGAGESVDLLTVGNTQGVAHFDFFVNGNNQRFQWDLYSGDSGSTSWAMEYDRWYLVETQVEFDGTTHSAQVRIDGVPQTAIASTGTDSAVKQVTVGSAAAKTHTQDYDDLELRVDDAPLGWPADTPPTVSLRRPTNGAVVGDDTVVTADFSCGVTDHTISSCTGTVADGAPIATGQLGARQFTVTATDAAGYTTTRTHTYTVVDDDDPTVTITTPADGEVLTLGSSVAADFSCGDDDALAASAACVGTVADGTELDTSTIGPRQVTVTATDAAGNTASRTHTYTVVAHRPDAQIRLASRARFGGDDVYSLTGARQTTQTTIGRWSAAGFLVRVENDGAAIDDVVVRGSAPRPGWSVRWFAGEREITRAVRRGTHVLTDLAPGGGRVLRVVIRPVGAGAGRQDVTLTARAGNARDTVRAIVRRR